MFKKTMFDILANVVSLNTGSSFYINLLFSATIFGLVCLGLTYVASKLGGVLQVKFVLVLFVV